MIRQERNGHLGSNSRFEGSLTQGVVNADGTD